MDRRRPVRIPPGRSGWQHFGNRVGSWTKLPSVHRVPSFPLWRSGCVPSSVSGSCPRLGRATTPGLVYLPPLRARPGVHYAVRAGAERDDRAVLPDAQRGVPLASSVHQPRL